MVKTIASKQTITGVVTRSNLNIPSNATVLFGDVSQKFTGSEYILQDLDIAYSINNAENAIPFQIYNNHTSGSEIRITFRVLAYI